MREDIKQAYVKNCIICFTVFEIAPAKAFLQMLFFRRNFENEH